ncbi:Alpha/Beta hydrolase protein [Flammula alnicola]|nr:Alpha/Beta hydrolase protein [Flammula alnicola]
MLRGQHLHDELARNRARVTVDTAFGPVTGGRATNGSVVFLEVPYALPPGRFEAPVSLPKDYRYEQKDTFEKLHAAQPTNDGQAAGIPFQDKVGYGKPSENPLFLNIAIPPSFPKQRNFPVKIYVHGGFLQFGSPHSLGSQAQYIAAERSEIWVNMGYRLSAFGFLASDNPKIPGNYGFKDQWMALEWIKANIEAFGGNPDDIQLTGLSAGAHSVHQLLHHASILLHGKKAPFQSAILQSNAILCYRPQKPSELRPQFDALCRALNHFGTFRGCLADDWVNVNPGLVEWQRSGGLARGLQEHGVRSVVVGDLIEEWYLYSIAHPIDANAGSDEATKLYGDIMSCGQVHLPVSCLRKTWKQRIRWSPEQYRPAGYVTHGCDRILWALRTSSLKPDQIDVAKAWLNNISEEVAAMNSGKRLTEDKSIVWTDDAKWDEIMKLQDVLQLGVTTVRRSVKSLTTSIGVLKA